MKDHRNLNENPRIDFCVREFGNFLNSGISSFRCFGKILHNFHWVFPALMGSVVPKFRKTWGKWLCQLCWAPVHPCYTSASKYHITGLADFLAICSQLTILRFWQNRFELETFRAALSLSTEDFFPLKKCRFIFNITN